MSDPVENPLSEENFAYVLGCLIAYRFVTAGFIEETAGLPIAAPGIIEKAERQIENTNINVAFFQELFGISHQIGQHEDKFLEGYTRSLTTIKNHIR